MRTASTWMIGTVATLATPLLLAGCTAGSETGTDGEGGANGGGSGVGGMSGSSGQGGGAGSGTGGSSAMGGMGGTGGTGGSAGSGGTGGLGGAGAGGTAGSGGGAGFGGGGSSGSGGAAGSGGTGGAGGMGGTGGTGGAAGSGGTGGAGGMIDPDCVDGQTFASEAIPTRADINDLVDQYQPAERQAWAIQVLERRYPTGAFILAEANNKTDCFEISFSSTATAQDIIVGLRTAVHECGHMIDLNEPTRFVLREDLQYTCDFTIPRSGPARGIILEDAFQALWPDDSFKATYLEQLGDQTFEALLNEASQYINTLATSFAFYDFTTFDPIARDGVHAFYWYVTRFLQKTRLENTADYDKLVNDQCWRQLVLALWGRSYRYLVETKGLEGLGSKDDALLQELHAEPVLLEEIQRLRVLDGCG